MVLALVPIEFTPHVVEDLLLDVLALDVQVELLLTSNPAARSLD